MKCILHIGTEKTGSTSIQDFCFNNRQLLFQQDIIFSNSMLYPGENNHSHLPYLGFGNERFDEYHVLHGLTDETKKGEHKNKIFLELEKEVKSNPKKTFLFSSEHLQSRLWEEKEVEALKKNLINVGFNDFKIILYIRDQLSTAISLFSTGVKTGNVIDNVPTPDDFLWNHICDHEGTINRWSSVFGDSSLLIRIFEKNEFVGNSLTIDFLNTAGLSNNDKFDPVEVKNKSLSGLGIKVLNEINAQIPLYIGGELNLDRSNITNFFEKYFTEGQRYCPNQEIIDHYDSAYKDSNERVRQNFFPEREKLFKNEITYRKPTDIDDMDIKVIANIFLQLWRSSN